MPTRSKTQLDTINSDTHALIKKLRDEGRLAEIIREEVDALQS
ncbi:MAG: hypothetical protein ACFB21_08960 [Opitutales bacterium]